jgi:CO/xanthine dehydrogenase FAD-binding subunit
MLNLRLAQPDSLVDLSGIASLVRASDLGSAVFIGAGVTHAAIEDGKVPDPTHGLLRRVASRIAYRAVRNRGTIGGSLAHADPAADWVNTMLLVDATYLIDGPASSREVASGDFMQAAFTTALGESDVLIGVRIAKYSPTARFGYFKFCRKVGEFAEAIGAVAIDPARGVRRAIIGALAIPAERILETPDGATVAMGSRTFRFLDTPGHAKHHVAIVDGRQHYAAGVAQQVTQAALAARNARADTIRASIQQRKASAAAASAEPQILSVSEVRSKAAMKGGGR